RRAIVLAPGEAKAHGALGLTLLRLGRFAEARVSYQRALDLFPSGHRHRKLVTQHLRQCEVLLKLDARLAAVLRGEATPRDAAERPALALLCLDLKHLPATAVRFFAEALTDSTPAHGLDEEVWFAAARAAARAAAGGGADAAGLNDRERARLRGRALDWL